MKKIVKPSKKRIALIIVGLAVISASLLFFFHDLELDSSCSASSTPYNISQSWSCGNGLPCTGGDCGQRLELFNSDWSANFSTPRAGAYSCTVNITETDYGYHDHDWAAPQQQEYSDVYINGTGLGTTQDYGCNVGGYGTACRDCGDYTTQFTQTVTLQTNNTILVHAHQSHGIKYVSVSCHELNPPAPPSCAAGSPAARPAP